MPRLTFRALSAFTLLIALLIPLTASAHEDVTVGKYALEIGWVNEPVFLGGVNAVFLSVTNTETGDPVEGLTTLQVSIMTGGQTRDLQFRPLGEDAPGQYAADFIPTVRGAYTVKLTGQIEEQAVDISQAIEEVELAEALQFPVVLPSLPELNQQVASLKAELAAVQARANTAQAIAVVGVVLGVLSAGVGVVRLLKKK